MKLNFLNLKFNIEKLLYMPGSVSKQFNVLCIEYVGKTQYLHFKIKTQFF